MLVFGFKIKSKRKEGDDLSIVPFCRKPGFLGEIQIAINFV
jgi:hypothetical protein